VEDNAAEPDPSHGNDGAIDRAAAVANPVSPSVAASAFGWCFRSRTTGQITIAQFPNVPLWIFLASIVLRRVLPAGTPAHTTVSWFGAISLGWWALDELIRGVNPWRRVLGLAGTVLALFDVAALLH